MEKVRRLAGRDRDPWVSLTGGEPLDQAPFLAELIPVLRREGMRVYLETGGTMFEELKKVIRLCHVVSADLKLPSGVGRTFWKEQREFYRLAGRKAFAKMVLTGATPDAEVEEGIRFLSRLPVVPPLVLQPVTPIRRALRSPSAAQIARWGRLAASVLRDVRVIPQMHRLWGVR